MTPSDPDTIMSAMIEAQRLTNACGQMITVFTNDQQLYRVAVNVTWVYPRLFTNCVPRLGGMHFIMSFFGAVGTLMSNTGLTEIMQTTFGGVPKMLSGKKFPQNVRALRMVASIAPCAAVSYIFPNLGHEIVLNIQNCTDLGNCLVPVDTYTGYKYISFCRSFFRRI